MAIDDEDKSQVAAANAARKALIATRANAEKDRNAALYASLAPSNAPVDVTNIPVEFVQNGAIQMGAPPLPAAAVEVGGVSYAAGLYIASAATGAGKSITSAALCHYFLTNGVPAGFLYVNEARAVRGFITHDPSPDAQGEFEQAPLSDFLARFTGIGLDPAFEAQFDRDWSQYMLENWDTAVQAGRTTLLVIDSMTLAMRAHVATGKIERQKGRAGEPTMEQGLQPSDIAFCQELQTWAMAHNVIIIGLVNDELVPFSAKLEGVTEGMLRVTKPGSFTMRNRQTRLLNKIDLPQASFDYARSVFLRYGSQASPLGEDEIPGMSVGLQPAANPTVYEAPKAPRP